MDIATLKNLWQIAYDVNHMARVGYETNPNDANLERWTTALTNLERATKLYRDALMGRENS